MPLFDELDDFDHFNVAGMNIDGFNVDVRNVRLAMVRIVNALDRREMMFVGEVAALIEMSIERTEDVLTHLMNVDLIKYVDPELLTKRGVNNVAWVVEINKTTLAKFHAKLAELYA